MSFSEESEITTSRSNDLVEVDARKESIPVDGANYWLRTDLYNLMQTILTKGNRYRFRTGKNVRSPVSQDIGLFLWGSPFQTSDGRNPS